MAKKTTAKRNTSGLKPAWTKGASGNPKGRTTAGALVREWFNWIAEKQLSESQLRELVGNKSTPVPKRAAAIQWLRSSRFGDMADFEPFLAGVVDLQTLRKGGLPTDMVKKVTVKVRVMTNGDQVTQREIELYDPKIAGEALDRIMDRTEGKPQQELKHTGKMAFCLPTITYEDVTATEEEEEE